MKAQVNPTSPSNQSSKPCTLLQSSTKCTENPHMEAKPQRRRARPSPWRSSPRTQGRARLARLRPTRRACIPRVHSVLLSPSLVHLLDQLLDCSLAYLPARSLARSLAARSLALSAFTCCKAIRSNLCSRDTLRCVVCMQYICVCVCECVFVCVCVSVCVCKCLSM